MIVTLAFLTKKECGYTFSIFAKALLKNCEQEREVDNILVDNVDHVE